MNFEDLWDYSKGNFAPPMAVMAAHFKRGYFEYEYIGLTPGKPNVTSFSILVHQCPDWNTTGDQIDTNVLVGIFDAGTNARISTVKIPKSKIPT